MSETPDQPSVVLHGFHGGIVNNAKVAQRLATVILNAVEGPGRGAACRPLAAKDHGDRWLITCTDSDASNIRSVDIRKSNAAVRFLGIKGPPQVLPNEDAAEKFAAILAENAGDADEVSQQSPFVVTDRGDAWFVRGSRNADRTFEGPFRLEVQKRDARVLDMCFEGVLHVPPEVTAALRKQKGA